MKILSLAAALVLWAAMCLAGCSATPKSPDVASSIRQSLDQAGLKDVSVSQDRDKGVITLGGQVPDDPSKEQAENIARSGAGGQVVANEIAVVPPAAESEAKTVNADTDKAIKLNLDAALVQNNLKKDVKYSVKNGVVTLTGKVRSETTRRDAESVASGVPDVQQVVNELEVGNRATSSN
jgi:hyperosmotically inducible periplasmic protein